MRRSIGAATAALVVAGTAFMACGGPSEDEVIREGVARRANYHARINCIQTETYLRERQGAEVTEEDRRQMEIECMRRLAR